MKATQVEKFLKKQIPLLKALKLSLKSYSGQMLQFKAPLKPNKNDKNTGFAGSIYSLAVITGWSLLFLKLQEAGLNCDIVIHKMEGTYDAPVEDDFFTEAVLCPKDEWGKFTTRIQAGKKAKISMEVKLSTESGVKFTLWGTYAAWKKEGL